RKPDGARRGRRAQPSARSRARRGRWRRPPWRESPEGNGDGRTRRDAPGSRGAPLRAQGLARLEEEPVSEVPEDDQGPGDESTGADALGDRRLAHRCADERAETAGIARRGGILILLGADEDGGRCQSRDERKEGVHHQRAEAGSRGSERDPSRSAGEEVSRPGEDGREGGGEERDRERGEQERQRAGGAPRGGAEVAPLGGDRRPGLTGTD